MEGKTTTPPRVPRARRKAVDLAEMSLVQIERFDDGPRAPHAVRPSAEGVDLAAWAADNHDLVEQKLRETGAILFRGFDLPHVDAFERAATALTAELYGGYGDLPREGKSEKI